jgi:hypothetical protein
VRLSATGSLYGRTPPLAVNSATVRRLFPESRRDDSSPREILNGYQEQEGLTNKQLAPQKYSSSHSLLKFEGGLIGAGLWSLPEFTEQSNFGLSVAQFDVRQIGTQGTPGDAPEESGAFKRLLAAI